MSDAVRHVPVLPREVQRWLDPRPGHVIADCTTGVGGHTWLIADLVGPTGRVIALDHDAAMLALARPRLDGLPVTAVHAPFDHLPRVLREHGVDRLDGVLADLGVCSDQLDSAERGFSFGQEGPLDMRMNRDDAETAAELIRRLPERDLADVIWQYGEERHSRRIAKRLVEQRKKEPIETTAQLADLVRRCVPRGKGIDPATRTFQALRIAVNDEMGALERLLQSLPAVLKPGGVAVLISFHSLEDRPVKRLFRDHDTWDELTRKPVTAADDEAAANPRSRSAKLRAGRLKERVTARA